MSATLDSSLFARYFGDCPTLAAGGRTFPVDQLFLEDVYEMTQYRLDAEGPAALRRHVDSSKQKALQKASGSRQGLVKVSGPACSGILQIEQKPRLAEVLPSRLVGGTLKRTWGRPTPTTTPSSTAATQATRARTWQGWTRTASTTTSWRTWSRSWQARQRRARSSSSCQVTWRSAAGMDGHPAAAADGRELACRHG